MKRIAIGFGLFLLVLVGARLLAFPFVDLRYRLAMTINLDGKDYTGSSVSQIRYEFANIKDFHNDTRTDAEALVIKLPDNAALVSMLVPSPGRPSSEPGSYRPTPSTMPVKEFGMAESVGALKLSTVLSVRLFGAKANVALDRLPLLVYLSNVNDPDTAKFVDPDNLAVTLGDHARIVSTEIETVSMWAWPLRWLVSLVTPMTRDVERTIPWARNYASLARFVAALRRDGYKSGGSLLIESLFVKEP